MSFQINQLCEDIKSAITVSGVNIYDLDDIMLNVYEANCPCLMPWPVTLINNWRVETLAFGTGANVPKRVYFTLQYRYFYAPAAMGTSDFDVFDDAIDKFELIVKAFMNDDDIRQAYDIQPRQAGSFGMVPDPSGKWFIGGDLYLDCTQER